MDEGLVISLLDEVAPQIMENLAEKVSCFRTILIRLPETTDHRELQTSIINIPQQQKLWQIWGDLTFNPSTLAMDAEPRKIFEALGENDFYVPFFVRKESILNPNWPQLVLVVYKEVSATEKYLLIQATFTQAQFIERGVLIADCAVVLGYVRNLFLQKGIDISDLITQARLFKDNLSRIDKKLPTWMVLLAVIGILAFILLTFYLMVNS